MSRNDGSTGWSQADTRYPQTMFDQHGREWFADIEMRSGAPTGLIRPRFTAPWYPEQSWLKPAGNHRRDVLAIDYEGAIASRLEAHREYHQRAVEESASRRWDVPTEGDPYSLELQLIVGKPPKPVEPIIAAMQNNSWILGFSKVPDPRLTKFIETREQRRQQVFANMPDFSDVPDVHSSGYAVDDVDEELESLMDYEEEHDREAVGSQHGRAVAKSTQKKKAPKNAQMKAAPPNDEAA